MLINYYKSNNLKYASRKRYKTLNDTPFYSENQKAVLLGNGANTSIKTKVENICDYVTIDDTRWFVISYEYFNGKQVQLNLQRDVIGEFGINSFFGKVERGFTDGILKYRKELSLNQILKNRKKLIPNSKQYGNYTVNTHDNEKWGILYLKKQTGIDPNTGEPYPERVNINIPAFEPETVDYPLIDNNSVFLNEKHNKNKVCLFIDIDVNGTNVPLAFAIDGDNPSNSGGLPWIFETPDGFPRIKARASDTRDPAGIGLDELNAIAIDLAGSFSRHLNSGDVQIPDITLNPNTINYDNVVIKNEEKFYRFTEKNYSKIEYGKIEKDSETYNVMLAAFVVYMQVLFDDFQIISQPDNVFASYTLDGSPSFFVEATGVKINRTELSAAESGAIVIDTTQQLVDEPYFVLVCPLYDVNISGSESYSVEQRLSFMVFNTIIQYLSGQNAYLVDAQIYPYCPTLISCMTSINGIPFFNINSSYYSHTCSVQLLPYSDVKREYIQRQYSIVSPEQSGKFDFNFYDYINVQKDKNGNNNISSDGINYATMNVTIKTALKPYSIISSAVIDRQGNPLIGITYESDLRGSQPSSNGFECSIATNAFEEYKRNNSNYQQIFALQREELQKQHSVERVNEQTSSIVNTLSAGVMGAIGGGALAGGGGGLIGKAVSGAGAAAGGAAASAIVGGAMNKQYEVNEELREYELTLQEERFNLEIGTIKNLPNSINRISSFNEIIMRDFYYVIETYECSEVEKTIVDNFILNYGYGIGVFDYIINYFKNGWFIRGNLISSNLNANLHIIANRELKGGFYLYE